MLIGRAEESEIALTLDRQVSRRHAVVEWVGDRLYLRDLSSTNGTMLNGAQIQGRVTLAENDIVVVGRSVLQLVFYPEASPKVYELGGGEETPEEASG